MGRMEAANRIDGTALARRIESRIAASHLPTTLEMVGFVAAEDPAGVSFQRAKKQSASRAGITYRIVSFPETISQDALASEIRAAAGDSLCGGIVIQLPLPAHLDTQALLDLVPIAKDVDVLSSAANAAYLSGTSAIAPPAVRATDIILQDRGYDLEDKTVAVVGMGRLIGQPIAAYCKGIADRVYELDKGFSEAALFEADLIVLGTGSYVLDPARLNAGTAVIDFGYRRGESGIAGDLDTTDDAELQRLSFYTPTPGGTGPVLIAALMENFERLNAKK